MVSKTHIIKITENFWVVDIPENGYDVKLLLQGNTPYQEYPCIEYKINEQTTLWFPCNGEIIGTIKKDSVDINWDILLNDDLIPENYWLNPEHTIYTFLSSHDIKEFEQLILLKKIN